MPFFYRNKPDGTRENKSIQFFPQQIPAYMEGDEWEEQRQAINRRNAQERQKLIDRMGCHGWHLDRRK